MASCIYIIAVLCVAVSAAPPTPPRLYPQHAPPQLQQLNPLDYYLDNPEMASYYNQAQTKQVNAGNGPRGVPSRLETLEPDSEVELIPGAQQPQQPPQQTPVSPNLPGLAPGQRVFIVHMPIPGYRPGTIGGYQPVYIVAAAPQGNAGFPANGYQNAVLLDPSGQAVISPLVGYPRPVNGIAAQGANHGYVLGTTPFTLNRPFDLVYQDPNVGYQPTAALHGADGSRGPARLSQLVGLQNQSSNPANNARATANEAQSAEPKRLGLRDSSESKNNDEVRSNARPVPAHVQNRKQ